MHIYHYKANNAFGDAIQGYIQGEDADQLQELLTSWGYEDVHCRRMWTSWMISEPRPSGWAMLCRQMAYAAAGEMDIRAGILVVAEQTDHPMLHWILLDTYQKMADTDSLYEAMHTNPHYPDYLLQLIRIGEKTQDLHTLWDHTAEHYETLHTVRDQLGKAAVYPTVLTLATLWVMGLISYQVFPILQSLVLDSGQDFPHLVIVLMNITRGLAIYVPIIAAVLMILWMGFHMLIRVDKIRLFVDRMRFHIPLYRTYYANVVSAQFTYCMEQLQSTDLTDSEALEMSGQAVGNKYLEKIWAETEPVDDQDAPLVVSVQLRSSGCFPKRMVRMLAIAERADQQQAAYQHLAVYYHQQLTSQMHRRIKTIEPVVSVILALFIGALLLGIALPVMDLLNGMG